MTIATLIQLCGLSAILAGLFSIATTLIPEETERRYPALEWVYTSNNFFLLLSFLGIYLFQVAGSGIWGLIGFLLGVLGALFSMRSTKTAGMEGYEFGGIFIALALIFLSIGSWLAGQFPIWIPGLWMLSILLGLPALFIKTYNRLGFILGGIPFGLGMIGAGFYLFSNPIF